MDAVLRHLRCGTLTVRLPDGSVRRYEGAAPGPHARVDVRDLRLVRRLVTTGAIGLADGWIDGDFDSPDLTAVIELAARHLEPPHRVQAPAIVERAGRRAWRTLGRAAAPRGPLRTTVQHYDLGNEFFASWLDDTMTYSSAWFVDDEMTLTGAQREKYRRLAESAGPAPGHARAGDRLGLGRVRPLRGRHRRLRRDHGDGLARASDLGRKAGGRGGPARPRPGAAWRTSRRPQDPSTR